MDLNFNQVTFDGDVDDLSEDEMAEVIREYQNAQESNVAEFERAADTLDEVDEADIEEFKDAKAAKVEETVEADAFEDVPLTEDELAEASFAKVRQWNEFVEAQSTEDGESDEDKNFDEMGTQGPTNTDDEFDEDLVQHVDALSGVNVE